MGHIWGLLLMLTTSTSIKMAHLLETFVFGSRVSSHCFNPGYCYYSMHDWYRATTCSERCKFSSKEFLISSWNPELCNFSLYCKLVISFHACCCGVKKKQSRLFSLFWWWCTSTPSSSVLVRWCRKCIRCSVICKSLLRGVEAWIWNSLKYCCIPEYLITFLPLPVHLLAIAVV